MKEIGEDGTVGADSDNNHEARENLLDQQWPGTGTAGTVHATTDVDSLGELTEYPEAVGTGDVLEPERDAEPYMAPIDPPVLPGGTEGIHTATGFGTSTDEEMERDSPLIRDGDIQDEATLILQNDSLTSHYNLLVTVQDRVVKVYGTVSDIDDAEHALSIVGEIPGVVDVIDDMTIDPNVT